MSPKILKLISLLGFAALFALYGCVGPSSSGNGQGDNGPETSSSSPSPAGGTSSSSAKDALTYDEFWDASSAMNISLAFSDSSLKALSDYGVNYSLKYADVYFPASFSLSFKGKSLSMEEVGVRMKGNNSREEIVDERGNIIGSCHFKISFKATFDGDLYDLPQFGSFKHDWSNDAAGRKARKKRRLADMEKVDLKYLPRNDGKTYSQEIYCFDVFRKCGIEAPLARWSSLSLSDSSSSKTASYELVESMDDVFLSHHFAGDSSGDLYKCSTYSGASQGTYLKADLALSGAVSSSFDSSGLANGARVEKGIPLKLSYFQNKLIQSGKINKGEVFGKEKAISLFAERFSSIDFNDASKDVIPFLFDKNEVSLWNSKLFIDSLSFLKFEE